MGREKFVGRVPEDHNLIRGMNGARMSMGEGPAILARSGLLK
jgi:hypothetical protein